LRSTIWLFASLSLIPLSDVSQSVRL